MSFEQKVLSAGTVNDLKACAAEIISYSGDEKILFFYGPMGAGKTTLIKAICEYLGAFEPATIPTFSIVNEYATADGKIFHFDFYRLKAETEALDMGYEEYFYSGNYCLIEWPEKITGLLPPTYIRISIAVMGGDLREIAIEKI
jgi:tRNA threonylcarbamoyladenosine biosynthesis protein TsaE